MRKKLGKSSKKRIDYYPFGMPMPNRNVEGDYRYGYQGEFAEKDKETGHNAFQLRMWDSRIGRWMSPDPYGEFDSPYLGMANNPISTVDPDGGCTDCTACPEACLQLNISQVPDGQGIGYDFDSDTYNLTESALGANLLETVILGDMTVHEFVGVPDTSTIEMFFPAGQNPILSIDRELKEQWKGLFDMTAASLGAGYSAAFPTVFANTRTQGVGTTVVRNSMPAANAANHLFRGANKLKDTPGNRQLITKIANGTSIATDKFGKVWHAKALKDGTVIYTYSRHGIIKGAGVNAGGGIEGVLSRIKF